MKYLLTLLFSITALAASAQRPSWERSSFSIGPETGFATNRASQSHGLMFGASMQGSFRVARQWHIITNLEIVAFQGKTNVGPNVPPQQWYDYSNFGIAGFKLGAKYYLKLPFYIQFSGGPAFIPSNPQNYSEITFAALVAPQVGYELPLGSHFADFSLRYEYAHQYGLSRAGSMGFVGLRAAFGF